MEIKKIAMFSSFRHAYQHRSASNQLRRLLSTAASGSGPTGGTPPKPNVFTQAKTFFYKNRQQLINIVGVYFVFSYAIHNYKVKIAWDEREVQFKALQNELQQLKASLGDEDWLQSLNHKVKASKGSAYIILKDEILTVIDASSAKAKGVEVDPAKKPDASNSELNALGAFVTGTGGGRVL